MYIYIWKHAEINLTKRYKRIFIRHPAPKYNAGVIPSLGIWFRGMQREQENHAT